MKLGVCAQVLYHLPFDDALATAADLGLEAIELPVDARSPFVDLDQALAGDWRRIAQAVKDKGLTISALSNHQEGQLLLGPHGEDTDGIFAGKPSAKVRYATDRLTKTAELAQRMEVSVVCAFTGCEEGARWFPWPMADGYERMATPFRERMLPLLDRFEQCGVVFAHECHPRQLAYNVETARWALDLLDEHPAFGFNLDPGNLLLAGVDPVVFVAELGEHIRHVHAKDGERVAHHAARSGLLAHGPWNRRDRGFRFRVPGWGDLDWRRLISELAMADYDGVLAIEHEDPTMSRMDGLRQAITHLEPLLLHEPREEAWW